MGVKQGTTVTNASSRGSGKRDTASLQAAYPESPLYTQTENAVKDDGSLGPTSKMREWYMTNVMDGSTASADENGESRANPDFPNYHMNYENNAAPDLSTVGTGDSSDLEDGSPYLPNLASPDSNTGIKPKNPSTQQPQGHSQQNGTTTTPKASSTVQSGFSLTNLPAKGEGPATSTSS